MRLASRISLGLLTIVAASCSEPGLSPRAGGATVQLSPVFDAAAQRAAAQLASAGLPTTSIRVVLVRPPSDTLRDTLVAFPQDQTELRLDLEVKAEDGEELDAGLQYKNGELLLFEGHASVRVHVGDLPANEPPAEIPVQYIGPDKDASSVSISPSSGSFPASGSITFTASVLDANQASVSGVPLTWSTSDGTVATIDANGVLHPTGKRGTITVAATSPKGLQGTSTITLIPAGTTLVVASGGGQSDEIHKTVAQPVVIELRAADGGPVPGQAVTFTSNAASVTPASATTDVNGQVQISVTLGRTAGTQRVVAQSGATSLNIDLTARPSPAATLRFDVGPGQPTAGSTIAPAIVVSVTDTAGNVVSSPERAITLSLPVGSDATLGGAATKTTSSGVATFSDLTVSLSGAGYTLTASSNGLTSVTSAPFVVLSTGQGTVPIGVGAATIRINAQTTAPRAGDTLSLTADQIDADGQATRITPRWTSNQPGRAAIDADGRLIALDTGDVTISASSGALVGTIAISIHPAPLLDAFQYSPKSFNNIGSATATMSVSFTAHDAGAGIATAQVILQAPDGSTRSCTATDPAIGTVHRGTWTCAITIPAGSPSGIWHVHQVVLNGSIARPYDEAALGTFGTTTVTVNP